MKNREEGNHSKSGRERRDGRINRWRGGRGRGTEGRKKITMKRK